jgi:predicted NUDIX family phosphoesterase
MIMQNTTQQEEAVLTIPRAKFEENPFQGYRSLRGKNYLFPILEDKASVKFVPRSLAENDASYKQIIPYMAVICKDEVLIYERDTSGSEDRLHGQLSIGIGGHVNTEDDPDDGLLAFLIGAARETKEEIQIDATIDDIAKSVYGLVNDETNMVGSVHLGVCCVLVIQDESREQVLMSCEGSLRNPRFIPIIELENPEIMEKLETWSKYFAMGYIQEHSVNGKWHDASFKERAGMLSISAASLASAATGYILEDTPRAHMQARERVERAIGEVLCLAEGLYQCDDADPNMVKMHSKAFFTELCNSLKYQDNEGK